MASGDWLVEARPVRSGITRCPTITAETSGSSVSYGTRSRARSSARGGTLTGPSWLLPLAAPWPGKCFGTVVTPAAS